jgi:hypothetical protein
MSLSLPLCLKLQPHDMPSFDQYHGFQFDDHLTVSHLMNINEEGGHKFFLDSNILIV